MLQVRFPSGRTTTVAALVMDGELVSRTTHLADGFAKVGLITIAGRAIEFAAGG